MKTGLNWLLNRIYRSFFVIQSKFQKFLI
ncbi:hypothetical protein PM8797T_15391 [Gimesia maris DSM 8797]|nr:hypothetical protein PM8797T_15391 [Gimesia maris DSM 8797]